MVTGNIDSRFIVHSGENGGDICWLDSLDSPFSLYGLIPPRNEDGVFMRLPEDIAAQCNEGVISLNCHTAGGRLTFVTDSDEICIQCRQHNISKMSHMALTGSAGFDLYEKYDGRYVYRGTFQPPFDVEDGYSSSLPVGRGGLREYTINFPLYSGVISLFIGLKDGSRLLKAEAYKRLLPVVYYGSSITQGGCASRPGNSYEAIISRYFDTDYINLGFSGSAKGEKAIADYISGLEMSVFVCDYDHNAPTAEHLAATLGGFIDTVRSKRPKTPIIMMSRPQVNPSADEITRRDIVKGVFEARKTCGDNNIYFIDGTRIMKIFGGDSGTVDNCHPNDLGFMCMAQALTDVLETALSK